MAAFDPLHVGHIAYLKAAAEFGDTLMVRVAPDTDIFEKGRVPFQDVAERLVTLIALSVVDSVCTAPSLADAVKEFKPTHLVKGSDWHGLLPDDVLAACAAMGTQVVFVNTQGKTSRERLGA